VIHNAPSELQILAGLFAFGCLDHGPGILHRKVSKLDVNTLWVLRLTRRTAVSQESIKGVRFICFGFLPNVMGSELVVGLGDAWLIPN
jgi:hypothetical protein